MLLSYLQIINISDKSNPYFVSEYNYSGYVNSVTVSGDLAYIGVKDNSVNLEIVNVSNPYSPFKVGGCDLPDIANNITIL